jgi:hypothetical protein
MRRTVAVFAIVIAFAAAMTPVAMANVRALHLCCPPKAQTQARQHDAMEHCEHDLASGSGAAVQSDMSDCSRHMISTPAPGVVHPAGQVVVGRPQSSHPILDEFAPLFAPAANQSSQKDRAPPAIVGQ